MASPLVIRIRLFARGRAMRERTNAGDAGRVEITYQRVDRTLTFESWRGRRRTVAYMNTKMRLESCLFTCLVLAATMSHGLPQNKDCTSAEASCQVAAPSPTNPGPTPIFPPVHDPIPITILVFSDFECFPCARSASVLAGLVGRSQDVRLIFKHAPAATNTNSLLAHEASLAADAQGKFWEMHNLLFANQTKLTLADLMGYAKQLGLDLTAFRKALDKHTYRHVVERDLAEARALGVTTAPTFFVNGRRLVGPQGYASLQAVIDSLLAETPRNQPEQYDARRCGDLDFGGYGPHPRFRGRKFSMGAIAIGRIRQLRNTRFLRSGLTTSPVNPAASPPMDDRNIASGGNSTIQINPSQARSNETARQRSAGAHGIIRRSRHPRRTYFSDT